MKCTQCGNTNFIEGLGFPIRISETWHMDSTFKMYVCDECGHVEFFYPGAVKKNNEIKELENSFSNSTKKLKSDLEYLINLQNEMNSKAKAKYEKEVEQLELLLKDETITVAKHKKTQEQLGILKSYRLDKKLELAGLSLADYPDGKHISTLQLQLKKLEKEHKNTLQQVHSKYKF